MDENRPTEPLPSADPQYGGQYAQQQYTQPQHAQQQYEQQPYGPGPQPYGTGPQRPTVATEPFYKRHGLAFAISTLVLAAVLLIGIAGAGAFAVGSVLFHAASVSHVLRDGGPVPVPAPGGPKGGGQYGGGQNGQGQNGQGQNGRQDQGPIAKSVVRGSVTRIEGSRWTITTARGATLTVDTSSSTAYGAPGQNQKASDFAVGDDVIVVGQRSGTTVTALRILKTSDLPLRLPASPGPTATPGK